MLDVPFQPLYKLRGFAISTFTCLLCPFLHLVKQTNFFRRRPLKERYHHLNSLVYGLLKHFIASVLLFYLFYLLREDAHGRLIHVYGVMVRVFERVAMMFERLGKGFR